MCLSLQGVTDLCAVTAYYSKLVYLVAYIVLIVTLRIAIYNMHVCTCTYETPGESIQFMPPSISNLEPLTMWIVNLLGQLVKVVDTSYGSCPLILLPDVPCI